MPGFLGRLAAYFLSGAAGGGLLVGTEPKVILFGLLAALLAAAAEYFGRLAAKAQSPDDAEEE